MTIQWSNPNNSSLNYDTMQELKDIENTFLPLLASFNANLNSIEAIVQMNNPFSVVYKANEGTPYKC